MLVNVLQRSVGLIRGLGFAKFLPDVELGQWALANSFLVIAVPLFVFGVPGSFGKFIEYYRVRNQLGSYVTRAIWVALFGATVAGIAILAAPASFGYFVFDAELPGYVIVWCVVCLLSTIYQSFVHELVASGVCSTSGEPLLHPDAYYTLNQIP